jgi:glucosyl-3-phosphoglycerate synthase
MSKSTAEAAAKRWEQTRTFHHSPYSPERIAAAKAKQGCSVSVCLPARECAGTVGEIVNALVGARAGGAIDEIVVIDAGSADGTAAIAERAGARVYQEHELMPELGPILGKGDAMYRALGGGAVSGEIVCYLDADTSGASGHYATGLLGPLLCEASGAEGAAGEGRIEFVKAFYKRPFEYGGLSVPDGGGRVNRLLARPALALLYPQLAAVRQPLAGEVAARRELLERVPFATGYGVEIGMLIDVWREVGLEGIAQVDLEEHRNRHQSLSELEPMARTVLATIARRVQAEGRLTGVEVGESVIERPPLAEVDDGRVGRAAPVTDPGVVDVRGGDATARARMAER